MSAAISASRVQNCIRSALADEVVAIGGIEVAQQECGLSDDTIRRRLAGTHAWSDRDIGAMVAAAQGRLGHSLVVQRLAALLSGAPVQVADGRRATQDAARMLPDLLALAQTMATAIADRSISRDEARALVGAIPDLIRALETQQADLNALLRDGSLP